MTIEKVPSRYSVPEDRKNAFFYQIAEKLEHPEFFRSRIHALDIQGTPEMIKKFLDELDQVGADTALNVLKHCDWLVDDKRSVLNSQVGFKKDKLVLIIRKPGLEQELLRLFDIPRHLYLDYYLSDRLNIDITDFLYGFTCEKPFSNCSDEEKEKMSKLTWSFHSGDQTMISKVKEILDPYLKEFEKD